MTNFETWARIVAAFLGIAALPALAADFNDDSKQDLVWRNHAGNPVVWQMNGLAVGSRSTLPIAPDAASAIVGSGNFFGSGPGGILWVDSSNELSIWRVANGTIMQACVVTSGIDPTWSYLGIGDMDDDGRDDVWWRLTDGSVKVFLIDGCNAPEILTIDATADPSWSFAGIGDVDGAGRAALFWRNSTGGVILWRLHNSTSVFSTTLSAGTYATWSIAAVADFDGDGKADVLWRDTGGTQTALWLMNGTKFTAATITPASPNIFAAADAVFTSGFDSSVRPAPAPTSSWTVLAATDVNGDGRSDVVLADDVGQTAIWQMQGSSITATGLISASPDKPYTELTGWRMALDRPVITKVSNQVTIAWRNISGPQNYIVYASPANDPESTGVPIAAAGASLSFGRNDNGYGDKRYFAVGAKYLGVRLPPSPEAYIVEFAATLLPAWGPMAIADLNGDGCIDILGAAGDCHGHFQPLDQYSIGLGPMFANGRAFRDARFADLNGDGILDVVANTFNCDVPECGGNPSNSQLQLFFGKADGTFTQDLSFSALSLPGGGFGETIVIADFNNDGYLDIFLPKYTAYDPSEHAFLLINDGSGHFTEGADIAGVAMRNIPLCARPEGAQAVDLNGDGRIDLYAGSHMFFNTGVNQNGMPLFSDFGVTIDSACNLITPSPAGLPVFMDEGTKFIDLDNSGQLSLALNGDSLPASIRVLKFDGIAHFSDANVVPTFFLDQAWGFNAADVDGDGLSDLVVGGGCGSAFYGGGEIDPACTTFGNPHALPQLLVNRGGQFVVHDFFDDGLQPTQRGWHTLLSYADFDYNGTVDFVSLATGGPQTGHYSVINQATSFATVTVSVVGASGEQNQAGRVVRVSPMLRPSVIMTQVVDGGSGYMSNGPYDLTFATPYPGPYTVSVRFANASYVVTALSGSHVTMRANGTYSVQ